MIPATVAILGSWLVGCSIASFALMGLDKQAARAQLARTSEAKLLMLAAIGGWPGTFVAMHVFRHKTRKDSFQLRCALASAINAVLVLLVIVLKETLR